MDFISLSLNYWEDLWQSRHQIMGCLAREHRVLFVSPPFSFAQVVQRRKRRDLPQSGLVHRADNLHSLVFSKWLFETYGHPRLERAMRRLREAQIRSVAARLGFQDPVLVIWHPYFAHFMGRLGESLVCYYADDEFAAYDSQTEDERRRIREAEELLLARADCVFANGPALVKAKNRKGNVIDVPMCADFSLYSRSTLPETKIPEDLAAIRQPRIGYIGNLNNKVDFSLLFHIARARPSWSIVLIGPANVHSAATQATVNKLKRLPNVSFLGEKLRTTLPDYIKGLDVCLMCYNVEAWAYYVYPLKLHEYLASGKPIVGSPLESLKQFDGVIRIATTPAEWVAGIEAGLLESDPQLTARRIQVAYDNRLEARVETILDAIRSKRQDSATLRSPSASAAQPVSNS